MQRLDTQDALLLYGEATGWPLHIGSLAVYDPSTSPEGLDVERVRELYRRRLPHLPVFRHRLVRVPGALDRPVWVEDPDVDVAAHIHGVRLPEPGTDQQLAHLVGDRCSSPLDLGRPPWEVWVVEGLHDGSVALLTRLHHSAADGVRGMEVQAATFDLDPSDPMLRPGGVPGAGAEVPGRLRLLGGAGARLATTPLRLLGTAGRAARASGRLADLARRRELSGLALPFTAPRTSLNRAVTARRGLAFCSLPLGPVRETAHREGVTVNDVVLALTSGALRRYLDARGELPRRSLTAAVPLGVTVDGPSQPIGGNHWQVMVSSLATDVADPVERLRRIARSSRAGKAVQRAVGPELWRDFIDVPPALVTLAARGYAGLRLVERHPTVVNVVVSSMRGAPFPLYCAGARLKANYPMGPIADGLGLNITVISYLDTLDLGLTVCPDLVEEPWRLVDAFREEGAALERRCRAPHPPTGSRGSLAVST